jgi:hypothetical protein
MPVASKGGRPIGSPKSGGRKRGTPNKRSLLVAERLENIGCDPIAILASICMDVGAPIDARIRCAIELSCYVYPKRRPIDDPKPQQSTNQLKTVIDTKPVDASSKDDEN